MTVFVLTAVPVSLRGALTRWLFEVAPGVFVGRVSARIRELLWERIVAGIGRGRAILVYPARNEQGLTFRVHGHDWQPIDHEGLQLMLRPIENRRGTRSAAVREPGRPARRTPRNWSYAERRLRGDRDPGPDA